MTSHQEPKSWRGECGEDEMTQADWELRAAEQARAMLHATDPLLSSPDEKGFPTGGMYNADYSDEAHEYLNQLYDEDEEYRDKVDQTSKDVSRQIMED